MKKDSKNNAKKSSHDGHNGESDGLWVEFRLIAFGSSFAGMLECKDRNDEFLLRMFKRLGLMRADGLPSNSSFVFRHKMVRIGQPIREVKYQLLLCVGDKDKVVEAGDIGSVDYSGEHKQILSFHVHGKESVSWIFVCDKNPRIEAQLGRVSSSYPYPVMSAGSVRFNPSGAASDRIENCAPFPKHSKIDLIKSRHLGGENIGMTSLPTPTPIPTPIQALTPVRKVVPAVAPPQPKAIIPMREKVIKPVVVKVKVLKIPQVLPKKGRISESGGVEIWVPKDEVIPFQPDLNSPKFSGQPRKYFCPKKLKKLADSIEEFGQQTAIKAISVTNVPGKKYELCDGERRWRAINMVIGLDMVLITLSTYASKKDQHLASLIHNFNQEGHTHLELSNALQEQIDAGETVGRLGKAIDRSQVTISNLLSLQKLHPTLKVLLDPPTPARDRIRQAQGIYLSKIESERQVEIWEEAKMQSNQRLVMLKLKELGAPYIVNKRVRKAKLSKVLSRRLAYLDGTIMELQQILPAQWQSLLVARGALAEGQPPEVARLNAVEASLQEIKQRIINARTVVRQRALKSAGQALETTEESKEPSAIVVTNAVQP